MMIDWIMPVAIVLFVIWVSLLIMGVGGYILMKLIHQERTILRDFEDDDLDSVV